MSTDVTAALSRILAAAAESKPQPFRYRFSRAGDPCLRALVYDAQDHDDGLPPREGKREASWSLSAAVGTAIGERLERAAVELGGWRRQVPVVFDTGAVQVRGEADLVGPDVVIDFKVAGEKKWHRVQRAPDEAHVLQVNGYAVALDRPRWALCYVRAISIHDGSATPELRVHEGVASVELAQQLCSTWESVEQHRKLRTLPDRVWGASPHRWPCGWCRHLERCGPTEEEESDA